MDQKIGQKIRTALYNAFDNSKVLKHFKNLSKNNDDPKIDDQIENTIKYAKSLYAGESKQEILFETFNYNLFLFEGNFYCCGISLDLI